MPSTNSSKDDRESTDPAALVQLIVDYVKQQTLSPLKGLGRYLVFGIFGSICLSLAVVLLALGSLRLLQGETGNFFDGARSWLPYVAVLVALIVALLLAISRITRGSARRRRRSDV